jgi:hypothetical protein
MLRLMALREPSWDPPQSRQPARTLPVTAGRLRTPVKVACMSAYLRQRGATYPYHMRSMALVTPSRRRTRRITHTADSHTALPDDHSDNLLPLSPPRTRRTSHGDAVFPEHDPPARSTAAPSILSVVSRGAAPADHVEE